MARGGPKELKSVEVAITPSVTESYAAAEQVYWIAFAADEEEVGRRVFWGVLPHGSWVHVLLSIFIVDT